MYIGKVPRDKHRELVSVLHTIIAKKRKKAQESKKKTGSSKGYHCTPAFVLGMAKAAIQQVSRSIVHQQSALYLA